MQRARTIGTGHVMVPPRTARWRGSVRTLAVS
jgi:hypothetical protein